jgi:hypothetical protein
LLRVAVSASAATLAVITAWPAVAAGRLLQTEPACTTDVAFGVIDARSACFQKDGSSYISSTPVRINGVTVSPLSAGQPLRIDPTRRSLSLARIQLRVGPIVLFQGRMEWIVPAGDRVTLAEFDLATHSRVDTPPSDTEAASDLSGDDAASIAGFDLRGHVKLELAKGESILTGTVELPKVFTDPEGHGLTGTVQVTADNDRGLHLSGIRVVAPRAFLGRLELENLSVTYSADGNSDATATCNADAPGLRFDGSADAVVVPTPKPLRLQDVRIGFADGAFSYGSATWVPPAPGQDIGGSVRVQRVSISMCAGPPVRLEGRIGLTALPAADGKPAFTIPDAGLLFEGGDPWSLRVEAPLATLSKGGSDYRFTDLTVRYRSSGAVDFGGNVAFSVPVSGATEVGTLDAAVNVEAKAQGFIDGDRFNAELDARGCFAGTLRIADTLPLSIGGEDLCVGVKGLVSSTGIAVCGEIHLKGKTFGLGAGYRWSGPLTLIAGTCDLSPWQVSSLAARSALAARSVVVRPGTHGMLLAAQGTAAAPAIELRGPHGQRLLTPTDPNRALRTPAAVAFCNVATRTTYVLIADPAPGTWTLTPRGSTPISAVRRADVLPIPRIRATAHGDVLRYAVAPVAGQRVAFLERGASGARLLGPARTPRGTLALHRDSGRRGRRVIEAIVEQSGLPRRRMPVAAYVAAGQRRPRRPRALALQTAPTALAVRWRRTPGAARYAIRVALPDGRRLLFLRARDHRSVTVATPMGGGRVSIRVVGLGPDNVAGPAARVTMSLGARKAP